MEYLLTNDQPLLPMSTSADILEGISDALYVLDRDWRFTYLNERASVILQRSREELLGKTVWEEFPDVAGTVFDTEFHRAMAHGTTTGFEVDYHRLGGWFELRVYPSPDGLVIFFQDINTRKHADAALRESEARYRTLINHLPAVTYTETLDPATRRVQASPQIEALTGYSLDEWETRSELWISMIHPDDRKQVVAEIERTDATGEPFQMEFRCVRKDGRVIWIRNEAVLLNNQAGQPAAWQGFMIDITERKELEAQLVHAAYHDALTGLPNRALFLERAQQALVGAQRSGRSIAVLFLDLDNFKLINDTFGHIRGDELLIRVAAVLRMGLHAGETLTRLGGDEFVILIEELADVGDAVVVADRQLERLRQPLTLAGRHVQLSASIGIVVSAERHSTPVELLRDADIALYQAKDSGKQRVVVFESAMHAAVMERRELEAELRVALERNEFVLHFQPIMALATGTIDGVEALVRWQHPTRGFISPLTFIPIAEASGLIHALGEWVLREACSHAATWCGLQPGAEPFRVSVNLSSQEFAAPDLVTRVSAVLTDIGFRPECLTLEMTESDVMDDAVAAIERLRDLKALGVQLAVDDFGTGYSSLAYLKRFPVDVLKIDRTFVSALGHRPEDTAIVSATITLAHALGLKVVAEGIETIEQLQLLRNLGCDRAQGYYFSRPVPAEMISGLMSGSFGAS